MAIAQTEHHSAGELITAAFSELAESRREVVIYLGVFLVAGLVGEPLVDAVPLIGGLGGLILFGGYFVAQYLLYRTLLRRAGYPIADGRIRIFRFTAMAFVIGLALALASNLFVIPAILLAARWIVAPCYIVSTERGLFASLGDSWSATDGNTLSLSLAFSALFLIFIVLFVALAAVDASLTSVTGSGAFAGLALHVLPLLLMGLSVGAYRRLDRQGKSLAETFA